MGNTRRTIMHKEQQHERKGAAMHRKEQSEKRKHEKSGNTRGVALEE
jgi:hypothetical protein